MPQIRVLFTGEQLRQRRRETIFHAPAGIEFVTQEPLEKMKPDYLISATNKNRKFWDFRGLARKLIHFFHIPNIRYVPNKYLKNVDVIYTPGQMLLNHFPYAVEVENVGALGFYNMQTINIRKKLIRHFLLSQHCKAIVCLSQASYQGFLKTLGEEGLKEKTKVVYPYVRINPFSKTKNLDKIIILTSNTKFYMKGTGEVLRAFEQLSKKYNNLEMWVISNTPPEYLEKYKAWSNIKFFPATFKKDQLYEQFYSQCDIFAQCSYQDSLGLTYLELAASGKPIVATDIFATSEVVVDGFNGYMVKSPFHNHNEDFTLKEQYFPMPVTDTENEFYNKIDGREVVEQLVDRLDRLVQDGELRQQMGENSLKIINDKFSLEERNKKLTEIFSKAAV